MDNRVSCFLALVLTSANASCGARVRDDLFVATQEPGIVRTPLLAEASGIVASRKHPGVIWAHNDSGDVPRVFALDTKANLLGICTITGAAARDWEDIAVGPGPDPNQQYLYIGDIGDNNARYRSVRVYRVPEPDVDPGRPFGQMQSSPAAMLELTYPDGPRDAETLLVDPQIGDIYLITKRITGLDLLSKVYRATWSKSSTAPVVLEWVTDLPWPFATGGDVSPDGNEVIVRGLYNASLWTRPAGELLWRAFEGQQIGLPLASEPQGEAIAFDSSGEGYFTLSEKAGARLHHFERREKPNESALSDAPAIR
ncbi:MAG: hypothetical protein JW993_08860 [Sedimentisphaerales bacterium]|nr:hypothetical protein [Sedimentisphaerales bacterium]